MLPNSLAPIHTPSVLDTATASYLEMLIERFCRSDDLASYDPYDMWKTTLGFRVKKLYNRRPLLGVLPAAMLALFDDLANHKLRWCYSRMEHSSARATAALCLLNLYRRHRHPGLLNDAQRHLKWLATHSCQGFSGQCWGLGFPHAVASDVIYDSGVPFSTITPYALEAFVRAAQIVEDQRFLPEIESIFEFFERDIQIMEEDDTALATSYGPFRDRTVINAVSYTMYSYCLFLQYAPAPKQPLIEAKVRKLYAYIRRHQQDDGSWYYSPHGRSFIDCFHSCIVLKNIVKSDRIVMLEDAAGVVAAGYRHLLGAFLDPSRFLFKRFSVRNKAGLVRYDLYDNAEALNLALLLGRRDLAGRLIASIVKTFCQGPDIYSQIDFMGGRKNKNTLRWAVMPFLYAASQMVVGEAECTKPLIELCSSN